MIVSLILLITIRVWVSFIGNKNKKTKQIEQQQLQQLQQLLQLQQQVQQHDKLSKRDQKIYTENSSNI